MLVKCKRLYYSEKPLILEWLTVVLISGIMLISFFYNDTKSLTVWSTNLIEVISEGRLWDFYLECYINEYGAYSPVCYGAFFSIIPWAVWNIPLWAIQKYLGIAIISNGWMMVWSKLFLVVMEVLLLILAYKITMFLTDNKNKALWVVLLTASFPFTYIGIYYAGQTDIISLVFSTAAIYALLRSKTKIFLVLSAMAIATKPIFFFVYILLVLLTEKNLFKILLKVVSGYSITLLFQVAFRNAPMYQESLEIGEAANNFEMMTRSSFGQALWTKGSWFFLLFIVLCVIAYVKQVSGENRQRYIVYLTVAPIMLVLAFTAIQHYRPIHLVPFLFIMFMLNEEWYRVNIILKVFYSISTLFATCCFSRFIFEKRSMENTLLNQMVPFQKDKFINIRQAFADFFGDYTVQHRVAATVSVACLLLMLVINYPSFRCKPEIDCKKCERWIYWIDMLLLIPVILYVFAIFLDF